MSLFIESIRIRCGEPQLLDLHQQRFEETRRHFYTRSPRYSLAKLIAAESFDRLTPEIKCRIVYGRAIQSVEFIPYRIRPVQRLHLAICNDIDYSFKFLDRAAFEALKNGLPENTETLIVKNGYITDTSYANIAFSDGQRWFTPAYPLLNGVQRRHLIRTGRLTEIPLSPADLSQFNAAVLINAMLDLENSPWIEDWE